MTKDEELLTVKEAAARLRIHPHTLRKWCRKGEMILSLPETFKKSTGIA